MLVNTFFDRLSFIFYLMWSILTLIINWFSFIHFDLLQMRNTSKYFQTIWNDQYVLIHCNVWNKIRFDYFITILYPIHPFCKYPYPFCIYIYFISHFIIIHHYILSFILYSFIFLCILFYFISLFIISLYIFILINPIM